MSKLNLKKLKRKSQKSGLSPTWQFCLFLAAMILLIWSCAAVAQNGTPTPTLTTSPDWQKIQKTVDELQKTVGELQKTANNSPLLMSVNTMWILFTGCLVFFMNAGFAMLEAGLCRHKNAVNILAQNFIVFALATVAFWGIGFALMFGDNTNPLLKPLFGADGWFFDGTNKHISEFFKDKSNAPLTALFFFQLVFADTAATIFTGAVAERIKFIAFFIFSFLLIGVSYPITGHWIWGGGWLSDLKFYDFAGSTVVHSVGGWAGLVGALLLKPRLYKLQDDGTPIYRYLENSKRIAMPGHNMSIATLGSLILWLGWFGFNAGSTLTADPKAISHIIFTTNMAAAGGGIAATIISWWRFGKPELTMILNGVLAGLVSITASSAFVNVRSAFVIGLIAGILVFFSVLFIDTKLKIDDPVGAISVHLVNGIWGTLAVGLFSVGPNVYSWYSKKLFLSTGLSPGPAKGLLVGGGLSGFNQVLIQLLGIFSVGLFTIIFSWLVWSAIKFTVGLRVSPEAELAGLDISEHDMDAYHGFEKKKV